MDGMRSCQTAHDWRRSTTQYRDVRFAEPCLYGPVSAVERRAISTRSKTQRHQLVVKRQANFAWSKNLRQRPRDLMEEQVGMHIAMNVRDVSRFRSAYDLTEKATKANSPHLGEGVNSSSASAVDAGTVGNDGIFISRWPSYSEGGLYMRPSTQRNVLYRAMAPVAKAKMVNSPHFTGCQGQDGRFTAFGG